jgi:hypothetical protein
MRKAASVLIGALVAVTAWAQDPNFDYPCFITNDDGYIVEDNNYCAPCFEDWDDDGDIDMMVGVFYDGNIWYYENVSTGVIPDFAPHTVLEADGAPIAVTYG